MQILPINNQQNSQSFKGLWGRKVAQASGSEVSSHVLEVFHYHPFADESAANIDYQLARKSSSWTCDGEGFSSSYASYAVPEDRLPFTEKEYDAYKALKGKQLDEAGLTVEEGLAKAKLHGYMNSRFKYYLRKLSQKLPKFLKK